MATILRFLSEGLFPGEELFLYSPVGVEWLTVSWVEQNVCTVWETLNSRTQWKDNTTETVTKPNKNLYGLYDGLSNSSNFQVCRNEIILLKNKWQERNVARVALCFAHCVQTGASETLGPLSYLEIQQINVIWLIHILKLPFFAVWWRNKGHMDKVVFHICRRKGKRPIILRCFFFFFIGLQPHICWHLVLIASALCPISPLRFKWSYTILIPLVFLGFYWWSPLWLFGLLWRKHWLNYLYFCVSTPARKAQLKLQPPLLPRKPLTSIGNTFVMILIFKLSF